jgi:hypothetical protein
MLEGPMSDDAKEILAFWDGHRFMAALVPKARGTGFLKVPAGHHVDPRIADLEEATGSSVYGLDGSLEVETSRGPNDEKWAGFLSGLRHLWPYPVRIVDAVEYWERHPIKTDPEFTGPRC